MATLVTDMHRPLKFANPDNTVKNGDCRISVKRGKAVAEKKGGAGVDD